MDIYPKTHISKVVLTILEKNPKFGGVFSRLNPGIFANSNSIERGIPKPSDHYSQKGHLYLYWKWILAHIENCLTCTFCFCACSSSHVVDLSPIFSKMSCCLCVFHLIFCSESCAHRLVVVVLSLQRVGKGLDCPYNQYLSFLWRTRQSQIFVL